MDEMTAIFKSYLRNLLRRQQNLLSVIEKQDTATALELLNELIEDTQKGIED